MGKALQKRMEVSNDLQADVSARAFLHDNEASRMSIQPVDKNITPGTNATMMAAKLDVYSFGLLSWSILAGAYPYSEYNTLELILAVTQHKERPSLEQIKRYFPATPEVECLLQQCWDPHPHNRPSSEETLAKLDAILADV